jgi:ribonuclease HI
VVVIQFIGQFGHCTILNIYNDCIRTTTQETLATFLEREIARLRPTADDHMIWTGDFNRHHPLWDEDRNTQLFTNTYLNAAQPLLDLIADYGMIMMLPKGLPTLQSSSSKNWTRPDNVFCTDHTGESFISCTTNPALRGPATDHVPILSILEFVVPRATVETKHNFRETDWEEFQEKLDLELAKIPPAQPLVDIDEFQTAARNLTITIQNIIEQVVPKSKPNPHSKRWWTKDLTMMRREVAKLSHLSYRNRSFAHHYSHEEHRIKRNQYSEAIKKVKKAHWIDWLEDLSGNEIWTANKYLTASAGDGGLSRIPTLKRPDGSTADTNEEKSTALAQAFFPPPPATSSVPEDFEYPDAVPTPTPLTLDQLQRSILKLSPYKAPGPDGICNIVFSRCANLLQPYLLHLFRAVFSLDTYYEPWRDFTTVVLRKPGKSDYTVTKAYRPIALLNTTCKLLTAVVANQMTYLLEHHELLPSTHFGGRPGRSTTDSLHLLEATIKDAWRQGKVVSALFLDIEGAFPNAVTDRLLHNMRTRRLPESLVRFTERLLNGRRTQLKFDGHLSDWIPITNGIGQGDPLSMILYIIYNADLVDVAKGRTKKERTLAFVDDTAFIAIGNDFHETHAILKDMLERAGGGYDWALAHNSKFETSKFALIDFSMNSVKDRPPLLTRGTTITPSETHKFLGVILDQALRWKAHVAYAIAKGTAYVLQLRRISSTSTGVPLSLMRQLYLSVAMPKMLYAVDLWFRPLYIGTNDKQQSGSIGIARRVGRVQRLAAISILGTMRSTASDTLEVHAKLLPAEHRMQNLCYQAALRLAAHPKSHPLYVPVRKAAKRYVKRHRSSLHYLFHASQIDIASIESITHSRRPPNDRNSYSISIASSRKQAIEEHNANNNEIKIYCDGSGIDGKVGAAAVLYRQGQPRPRTLRYHLGSIDEHTVYEAESVGLNLAAQLLSQEEDLTYPVSIYVDNQATIKSGELFSTKPGHYLIDHFRSAINELKKSSKDRNFKVKVHWISGHDGVAGNEKADDEAKKAAESRGNNSSTRRLPPFLRKGVLPSSISALKQAQRQESSERWGRFWSKSPRHARTIQTDPNLTAASNSFTSLVQHLPKRHISLMLWLRTRHISLNQHLHRIGKSLSPNCPHCEDTPETVQHFLLSCPQYIRERHTLTTALRRQASSITYLLTNAKATAHLIRFVNSTGRLKSTFGDVPPSSR